MAGDAPNVLLINADQWRGECLSTLGHPVAACARKMLSWRMAHAELTSRAAHFM